MPLTASYRWTFAEMMAALDLHQSRGLLRFRHVYMVAMALLIFVLVGVRLLLEPQFHAEPAVLGVLFGIACLLFPCFARAVLKWHFRGHPERDLEIAVEFSDEGVGRSSNVETARSQWGAYSSARASRTGLLLYVNNRMFFWTPASAFADSADYERLLALVARKVLTFRRFR